MTESVKLEPCPLCETGSNFCRITTSGTCKGTGSIPAGVRAIFDCDEFDRNVSNWATRLGLAFAAWSARHQPQREAVLEEALRVAKREIQSLGCDPDDIELALNRINRAALTTPAPAVKWGPKFAHLADEVEAIIDADAPAVSRDELLEAMLRARHRDFPEQWPDGYSEGVARIERMKAEWMLDAILSRLWGEGE